ncbi:MAG TPA: TRAP transporter small permease [Burkholderiales bacterium]|jgi:TRAP-type C4-dicarboxylate transport system permease small subunit|nr:TRAP transporter small permease [Burkholderiales bacterium]
MRDAYRRLMQRLYLGCIVLSGVGMVAITIIIPSGVFMRYVMNDPLQWPEPASVIMMVFFSFIGGAAVFRANQQIAVEALMRAVNAPSRAAMQWGVHACMLSIAAFMLVYGVHLCWLTKGNSIAEFPWLSVGIVYLPIPIAGVLTLLFIIEKIWLGEPPRDDVMYSDAPADLE